ncbi:MAG TPA: PPOX class F420-dependent oxidoreductase [Solirubrobacteraceae bacterium]
MRRTGPQRRRIAVAADRLYLWLRHRDAWRSSTADATTSRRGFSSLDGHKYCLLSTFRKSGEAVPTPVWFGLAEGNLYIRSEAGVGKIKRIRREPRVQIAPCTFRGRPLGPSAEGRARILTPGECERAERALKANYGLQRRLYEGTVGRLLYAELLYIEVTPVNPAREVETDD